MQKITNANHVSGLLLEINVNIVGEWSNENKWRCGVTESLLLVCERPGRQVKFALITNVRDSIKQEESK